MISVRLEEFTTARVGLGITGHSLATREVLNLRLAHAQAREAVLSALDPHHLEAELQSLGLPIFQVRSMAPDRSIYLKRPDLGRQLTPESRQSLKNQSGRCDVVFVLVDGLSARAVQQHAFHLLHLVVPALREEGWFIGPFAVVEQGRVAIGDEIGACLSANEAVVLIGERPGLSSFDSLGCYLTWKPGPYRSDADRNCISNIRAEGLSYQEASRRLLFLLRESRRRQLSGVHLKDQSQLLPPSKGDALYYGGS